MVMEDHLRMAVEPAGVPYQRVRVTIRSNLFAVEDLPEEAYPLPVFTFDRFASLFTCLDKRQVQ